jgi:hypothetical protein
MALNQLKQLNLKILVQKEQITTGKDFCHCQGF